MSFWEFTDPQLRPESWMEVQMVSVRIAERMREHRKPPETLWHYTTVPGAHAIVSNWSLRMSHIGYLNDSTEFIHGLFLLYAAILRQERVLNGIDLSLLWENMALRLRRLPQVDEFPSVYVGCYSAVKNDLSQWRAYSKGTQGFSLGFSHHRLLEEFPTNKNYAFMPVVYDQSFQSELADAYLSKMASICVSRFSKENSIVESDEFFEWLGFVLRTFAALATFFKEDSFKVEEEFRIAAFLPETSNVDYFAKDHLLVPFITHKLDTNPLDKIMTAPGPYGQMNVSAMRGLLRRKQISNVDVIPSYSPLRAI